LIAAEQHLKAPFPFAGKTHRVLTPSGGCG
jgi:hypothetical protein